MYRRILVLTVIFLLNVSPTLAEDQFKVVTSIKPIHSIVAGLMESLEGPELLISGKQTPYNFQPSKQQTLSIQQANLVIWVGPELESSLVTAIKGVGKSTQVIELLDMPSLKILPARKHDDANSRDPFFWLDTRNMLMLVDDITRILMNADPGHSHVYLRNREKVYAELALIDRRLEYGYRGLKGDQAVPYYDTLQYFEQAYALKNAEPLTASPRTSIETASLLKTSVALKNGDLACLLTEVGLPTKQLSLLTGDSSANVGMLDSFGLNLTAGPDLYVQLMRNTTDTIRKCINARQFPASVANTESTETPESSRLRGRFILINHKGEKITNEDLLGSYHLLYFGYTFCPDICPTSLQVTTQALSLLGDKAKDIKPYFITIDPQRDTVEVMRSYVKYFNEDLIGITGTVSMIERLAKQYRVLYEKVTEDAESPELYLMDHSASVYVIAPDGKFITKFAHGITPQAMAKRLQEILP